MATGGVKVLIRSDISLRIEGGYLTVELTKLHVLILHLFLGQRVAEECLCGREEAD